ncbi:MAG: hypothetical protein NTV23_07730 [Propionibacteriales bacterium]|nr:hypothetical protein [Propionibacteriales bacterium]
MTTPVRVGAFVAGLVVLFAAGLGLGKLVEDDAPADGGYRLRLTAGAAVAGSPVPIRFDVVANDDVVVTDFTIRHDKPLHLIAVRKDFGSYRHLHPAMDAAGRWAVDADLDAGSWRLYADFQPAGGDLQVLDADVTVAGTPVAAGSEPGGERRTWTEAGYTVEAVGSLAAGSGSDLEFRVSSQGRPVTDLEPYLGAYGHLVVIRDSDLGYLHAHPGDGPPGPEIPFGVEVPAVGGYHLFLDFRHRGAVRTATFVLDAAPGGTVEHEEGGHGDH